MLLKDLGGTNDFKKKNNLWSIKKTKIYIF